MKSRRLLFFMGDRRRVQPVSAYRKEKKQKGSRCSIGRQKNDVVCVYVRTLDNLLYVVKVLVQCGWKSDETTRAAALALVRRKK